MTPTDIEVAKIVINNSFSMITLAWSSGLAWWLSSSVFLLTLMGKVYPAKEDFTKRNLHTPVGIFVSFIFISLILFGIIVIHDLSVVETAIYEIFIDICSDFHAPNASHVFDLVRKLYVIVTSSLVVFLIAWLYLWFFENKSSTTINEP